MRLDEHFLSECLEDHFPDVPIEYVHYSRLLLSVELVCLFQVVDEVRLVQDLVALGFVELASLLDQLFV